jgi:Na+/H+ antiporter NhaD/arsenite permease-like protein
VFFQPVAAVPHAWQAKTMDYAIFGATLLGVALFHHRALHVALAGLAAVVVFQLASGPSLEIAAQEILGHLADEWVILTNLLLLLLGFAVLSNQFEQSGLPEVIPSWLPAGWVGGVVLLGLVFVLSSFLDNIAGAIIGGVAARHVFPRGVTVGFLAAITAAANAGGAGSVIGDTTTTMMWISGISPFEVLPAFIGALVAFAVFAPFAAIAQQKLSPLIQAELGILAIDWTRVGVVVFILTMLVSINVVANSSFPQHEEFAPVLGLGLWIAILVSAPLRSPAWSSARDALYGSLFLVVLVALASLMPLESLPEPSTVTTFSLGVLSAVFDNIPLTALALNQGGYDWGLLAYAVGFGGSMVWFGSSAGVALTNLFPEGRSLWAWVREGWSIPLSFIIGFLAMLATTA